MIIKDEPNTCTYVRLLNASAESEFDVLVNERLCAHKLGYKRYTKYSRALEGTYDFRILSDGQEILGQKIELERNMTYTVLVMGEKDSLALELIIDENGPAPSDKSFIRFINVSPRETDLNILINGERKLFDLEYGENGDYLELEPGEYELEATCSISGETKYIIPKSPFLGGTRYSGYIWPV